MGNATSAGVPGPVAPAAGNKGPTPAPISAGDPTSAVNCCGLMAPAAGNTSPALTSPGDPTSAESGAAAPAGVYGDGNSDDVAEGCDTSLMPPKIPVPAAADAEGPPTGNLTSSSSLSVSSSPGTLTAAAILVTSLPAEMASPAAGMPRPLESAGLEAAGIAGLVGDNAGSGEYSLRSSSVGRSAVAGGNGCKPCCHTAYHAPSPLEPPLARFGRDIKSHCNRWCAVWTAEAAAFKIGLHYIG